ncbi:MAG: hypothetical protein HZT41_15525 [Dechloromonas sp.]|jgi:hypothetical protein|nr:MAG: hypothetical protein HZT41_15525 [Dechloromonas sp.]
MKRLMLLLGPLLAGANVLAEAPVFVAGLAPYQRPADAPVITVFEQTPEWQARAMRGITPPPTGIDFLKYQGAWYTPFIHPNLTGRYDIRGLHADAARKDGS